MNYKIVFFDIDGTILTKEGIIPEETKEAVALLKEKNIDVCIATGRPLSGSIDIGKELGIDSYVTFNGSHVNYKGTDVFKNYIPDILVKRVVEESYKKNIPVLLNRLTGNYTTHMEHPHVKEVIMPLCFDPEPFNDEIRDTYQMILCCEWEKELEFDGLLNEVRLHRWHKYGADIYLPNVTKQLGVQKLLEHLDICPSEAIAFGDELNDKEMLSFVGMGVAMGNSNKELIPYSNYVTSCVDDSGIYHGLKKIGVI